MTRRHPSEWMLKNQKPDGSPPSWAAPVAKGGGVG